MAMCLGKCNTLTLTFKVKKYKAVDTRLSFNATYGLLFTVQIYILLSNNQFMQALYRI